MVLAVHIIAELYGCNRDLISFVENLRPLMEQAVEKSGLTEITSQYHQFTPFGVTGFVLLAESHISIHTWPEYQYAAVDIYTCSTEEKANNALTTILEGLSPQKVEVKKFYRGEIDGFHPISPDRYKAGINLRSES